MRKWLGGFLIALATASTGFAQVDLSYKPENKPGNEVRNQTELKVDQTLTLAGTPLKTKSEQFFVQSTKAGEPLAGGDVPSVQKIETMQMNLSLPGGLSFKFDSGNPNAAVSVEPLKPIVEFLKKLVGAELLTVQGADGVVKDVKWKDDAFADVDASLKGEVDPETMKKQINQDVNRLPGKTVNQGDSWTRTEELMLGGGQKMELEQEYTYAGPGELDGKPIERISLKTKSVKLWMEENPSNPVSFKNSDLTVKDSGGMLSYDPAKHVITHAETSLHVAGKLTVLAQGQELPSELDLTITTKVVQQ